MDTHQELVQGSSDPAFLLGPGGRILAWNEGAEELLDYASPEATGKPCWRVLYGVTSTGEPVCTPGCAASACFQRGLPFAAPDLHVRRKDGQSVPVSLSTLLLPQKKEQESEAPVAMVFLKPQTPTASATQPQVLRLHCLGPFRILFGAQPVDWNTWKRKQAVTFLAFLAHHRGSLVHRELILDALWPDTSVETALERLKVVVYSLRHQLGDAASAAVVRQGMFYALDHHRVWIDTVAFEEFIERGFHLASQGQTNLALASLEAARILYRGGYLEEERYSDWAQLERARLTERYIELLRVMGGLHERQKGHREAAQLYRLALAQDPCREEVHRLLIHALVTLGEKEEAAQQFRRCVEVLRKELGVDPSPETLALRDFLLARV